VPEAVTTLCEKKFLLISSLAAFGLRFQEFAAYPFGLLPSLLACCHTLPFPFPLLIDLGILRQFPFSKKKIHMCQLAAFKSCLLRKK
jgi:hypothetical protein